MASHLQQCGGRPSRVTSYNMTGASNTFLDNKANKKEDLTSPFYSRAICTRRERGESMAGGTPTLSHSIRRSNFSAASNSAFMAIAHSSSSDFWWKEMRAHERRRQSCQPECVTYPHPQGPELILAPYTPCLYSAPAGETLPLTHQDLWHLLLSLLFHSWRRDTRKGCVWNPGLHRYFWDFS